MRLLNVKFGDAKQELKPILAFVFGALFTLPTLVFVNGLKPTNIRLFGELSEDNGWKHKFFDLAGFSLLHLFFWLTLEAFLVKTMALTIWTCGLFLGYMHVHSIENEHILNISLFPMTVALMCQLNVVF